MLASSAQLDIGAHVVSIALVAGALAAWFGIYALALLATRPGLPDAAPATEDLGPEPPAIVSLVVNRWEITEDAAESTLLDLAARHILELRQPGNDPMQTTVHIRQPNPTGLSRYEQRVFDRVSSVAVGGVVPLPALTFRDKDAAAAWAKRLTADVIAEARIHGLSRRRLGTGLVSALVFLGGAAALGVAVGVIIWLNQTHAHKTIEPAFWTGVVTWFVLAGIASRSHGERDTQAGREVASRWLGVRAWLRGHDAFGDLPPAAVAVWDRYLSYGAAVGATRVSSAVIDLGMGNRRNVWSSYQPSGEPSWHRVRVHYPRFSRRYGKTAPKLLLKAAILGVIGYGFVRYWYSLIDTAFEAPSIEHSAAASYLTLIKSIGVLLGVVALTNLAYVVVRTVLDLATPVTITGEVVWTESWRSIGTEKRPQVIDYLAVDDGGSDQTKAWAYPHGVGPYLYAGDIVEFTVRRWSRRVTALTRTQSRSFSRTSILDIGAASENTEQMIASAMGIPSQRPILGTPISDHTPLVTIDEVGAVLGRPVKISGQLPTGVISTIVFKGTDGSPALTVTRTGGMVARMAMRGRRSAQEIAGIGDEARGGPGWLAVRRGDQVVMLHLDGSAAQSVPPTALMGLAHTAASRLPSVPVP